MGKRVTTNDPATALKWAAAFDAGKPITIEGKEYLLLELTTVCGHSVFGISGASALAEEYVVAGTTTAANITIKAGEELYKTVIRGTYPDYAVGDFHPAKPADSTASKRGASEEWRTTAETTNPTTVAEWSAAMETNGVIQWEGKKWVIEKLIKHGPLNAQAVLLPFMPLIDLSGTVTGRDESTAKAPKPQWDGTGLPPVGVEFEVLWDSDSKTYADVIAVGHDEGRAVFRFLSGERAGEYQAEKPGLFNSGTLPSFRPIKTAEQLEAEKRAAEIERMGKAVADKAHGSGDLVNTINGALYDAGVRFPAEDK